MASSSLSPVKPDDVNMVMTGEESRNWAELPPDIISSILFRLSTVEILENALTVCRSWRQVSKEPLMWRKIDMRNIGMYGFDYRKMCRLAVDLSQGGLVEFNMDHLGHDSFYSYLAERSSVLRCFRLDLIYPLVKEDQFVNAFTKFPFLEVLEISHRKPKLNLKAIGQSCPLLTTFKLNHSSFNDSHDYQMDGEALAIAETMPKLRNLELFGNSLTNSGLIAILDNCLHLELLDLRHCFNIALNEDMEKRLFERIRELKRPNDPTVFIDSSSSSSSEEEEEFEV